MVLGRIGKVEATVDKKAGLQSYYYERLLQALQRAKTRLLTLKRRNDCRRDE